MIGAHARLLRQAGHDVKVVAGRGDATTIAEIDSRHPEVERITRSLEAGKPDAAAFGRMRNTLVERLGKVLSDRDLLMVHNVMTMPLNLPLTAALLAIGKPILAWTHDVALTNPRYSGFHRTSEPYRLIAQAQPGVKYVAISQVRARELSAALSLSPQQVTVVPDGIDEPAFSALGRAPSIARQMGFAGADPLLLVPVRVTRRKRLELALEAAGHLRPHLLGLKAVVTGPLGPHSADNLAYWAELAALRARLGLDQTVIFCHEHPDADGRHPIEDSTMAALYRMADVVLLPSESEGFGLPVLEAGLARAPIVCCDLPILREVGGSGLTTFAVGAGGEEIAATVRRMLRTRGARLRRRVLRTYTWESVLPQIERVIEKGAGG